MGDWGSRNGGVIYNGQAVNAAEITGTTYGYYPLLLILILRSTTKVLQFVGEISHKEIF